MIKGTWKTEALIISQTEANCKGEKILVLIPERRCRLLLMPCFDGVKTR